MNNFFLQVHVVGRSIHYTIVSFINNPAVWGFLLGLCGAAIVMIILISENPAVVKLMLSHSPSDSFVKIVTRNVRGTYSTSYTSFEREYNRIRILFYSSALIFLLIIVVAMIKY